MIIKATRISTSGGHKKLFRHLMRTDENERVSVLKGTENDLSEAVLDASSRGGKYALRHVIFSPDEPLKDGQFEWLEKAFREEFGADGPLFIVRHEKGRAGGVVEAEHYHLAYAESLENGLTLDSRFSKRRHEKIARLSEMQFNHQMTLGKGTQAVIHALDRDGKGIQANIIRGAMYADDRTPESSFNDAQHQATKRRAGKSVLPSMRADLRAIWEDQNRVLLDFISAANDQGFLVSEGDKEGIWIVSDKAGNSLALHRVLGIKKRELDVLMTDADKPVPAPSEPVRGRDFVRERPMPPRRIPLVVQERFDVLAIVIRPKWKRAECRPEIIANPWKSEVRRLENMSLGEELSRHLEALIARMLNALFGWNIAVPVTSADQARQLVDGYAKECAEMRQNDVQEHFQRPEVRDALKERKALRAALLSPEQEVKIALEEGRFDELNPKTVVPPLPSPVAARRGRASLSI